MRSLWQNSISPSISPLLLYSLYFYRLQCIAIWHISSLISTQEAQDDGQPSPQQNSAGMQLLPPWSLVGCCFAVPGHRANRSALHSPALLPFPDLHQDPSRLFG